MTTMHKLLYLLREDELNSVAHWVRTSNLKLNRTKPVEVIFIGNKRRLQEPHSPVLPGIYRVKSITMIGAAVTSKPYKMITFY